MQNRLKNKQKTVIKIKKMTKSKHKPYKFLTIIILSLCLIHLLPVISCAHSGRTDADGGHYNSDTGEYHYHHGYPAHQHTGGVCPYESKGKTNRFSGSSSGNSSKKSEEISPQQSSVGSTTAVAKKTEKANSGIGRAIAFHIAFACFTVVVVILFVKKTRKPH